MKLFAGLSVTGLSLAAVLMAAPAAWAADDMTGSGHDQAAPMAGEKAPDPHWTYHGEGGPDQWGDLSVDFATCKLGRSQSPINVKATEKAQMNALEMRYHVTPVDLVNNGHSVKANYAEGSTLTVGGKTFELKQFHFHTPSEHAIDGKVFPMEMHLVHQNGRGELAVIGVMIEEGAHNLAADEVLKHAPLYPGNTRRVEGVLINVRDLMPMTDTYYRYMGSLTTPPCSEGVNWYVLKTPIQMSAEQIDHLHKVMGDNARPVQPRNRRLVLDAVGTR